MERVGLRLWSFDIMEKKMPSKSKMIRGISNVASWKLRSQLVRCSRRPDRILFLDVETTGLSHRYDKITVIGWCFGGRATTRIAGQDTSSLRDDAARAAVLVTFNGGQFDLGFMRREFPEIVFPKIHIDLMHLCRRVGLTGGQKFVENTLGIDLRVNVSEVDGAGAVALWRKYTQGDGDAIRKLILYNRADVAAMGAILDEICERMNLKSESSFKEVRFRDWSAPLGWQTLSGVSGLFDGE